MTTDTQQRHIREHPCPKCSGWDSQERGQGRRCFGYTFTNDAGERFALCTREEHSAGGKWHEGSQGWIHRLDPRTAPYSAPTRSRKRGRIVKAYDYRDEDGALLFQVVRTADPKDFPQRRPDGQGGYIWNLDGVRRVLYCLPELVAADPTQTVYLAEGEKDVDNLRALGMIVTTNPGGAGKWRAEYNESLRGRRVVILPDNDKDGHNHAAKVAATLHGIAASVKVLNLPVGTKCDVSDWLADGGTVERLIALAGATPEQVPPEGQQDIELASLLRGGEERAVWQPLVDPWPDPLADEALHGLAGRIVRTIEPQTEADSAALLSQLLIALGNCIGRTPYFMAEADRHALNLFGVLVGESSKGRKGTSWGHIRRLFGQVDPDWLTRVVDGLSSGEGLIESVRDSRIDPKDGTEIEAGAADKRLLVLSPEFASVLQVQKRDGTTLPSVLRNAWDGNTLRVMTRKNPLIATGAHIGIIGHITRDELLRSTDDTSATNGYLNRFLWCAVRRSKYLPFGGSLDDEDLFPLIQQLQEVVTFSRTVGEMRRDAEANDLWATVYPSLTEPGPGLVGSILGRAEAIVMRLACLYALLDKQRTITVPHLMAALAVWAYSAQSVRWIFGDRLGDPVADDLLRQLRASTDGLTRTQINDFFGGHRHTSRITTALRALEQRGLARCGREESGGRPVERWHATFPDVPGKEAE